MSVLPFPKPDQSSLFSSDTLAEAATPTPADSLPPDHAERAQALDITRSWIVEAPAGSGKTGLLIQRFLRLLGVVSEPEAVLALTFTNKATAEMRARVLQALESASAAGLRATMQSFERETMQAAQSALAQDARFGWRLLDNPHRLNIRTIDSLCGEIARAVPVLTGGIGQASPLTDASAVYAEAARSVFLALGGPDAVLNGALRTVLLLRDGNLQDCEHLLASMLQTREQWGRLVPLTAVELDEATLDRNVLPQLNETLRSVLCSALGDLQQSIPAATLGELAELASQLAVEPGYKDLPNPLRACSSLRSAPGGDAIDLPHWKALAHLLLKKDGTWRNSFNVNHVLLSIPKDRQKQLKDLIGSLELNERARQLLCSLDDLPPAEYPQDQWVLAKALFRLLHHALIELKLLFAERNVCDFTELSIAARSAMQHVEGSNRVTHALGTRLQHLLVDEMQDTSSSQYELLENLTRGWIAPAQTVFLVGDPKQSIYLFRQARVERFIESMESLTLGDVRLGLLRLTANFRSGATLVGAFNDMFAPVFQGTSDGVTYTPASPVHATAAHEELRWHADMLAATDDALQKSAERKRARREEAETVAKVVSDWHQRATVTGQPQHSVAVLVRSKNHAVGILKKLKEAAVPFRAVEMEQLNERPEVLDAFALTRALLHPSDRVAWLAVLRAPWCGASLAELYILAAGDDRQLANRPLRLLLRERAEAFAPDARGRVLRTLDVLDDAIESRGRSSFAADVEQAWHRLGAALYTSAAAGKNVRRYFELLQAEEENIGTLTAERLSASMRKLFAEPETSAGAVDVMTIHKAKGLEWDLVLVPALERAGRSDALPLLDWLELEIEGRDGRTESRVMLAPVPARGDEPGSLNRFVRKARSRQESAELKRLLYVAATRARTSLQLFATVAPTKTGLERRPNTLLQVVWEQALPEFEAIQRVNLPQPLEMPARVVADRERHSEALPALAASEEGPRASRSPRLERLPLSIDPLAVLRTTVPPVELPALSPQGRSAFERPEGSFAARALGNAVHLFLAHLADWIARHPELCTDQSALTAEIQTWSPRIRTMLRAAGLAPDEVERSTIVVQRALLRTVQNAEGLWLMQAHAGASNEGELFSVADAGSARKYRTDRSFYAGDRPFTDGNDVLWIVDYKTAESSGAQTEFLQGERDRYEPQLRTYAALHGQTLTAGTQIMLALYHPLVPQLQFWKYLA